MGLHQSDLTTTQLKVLGNAMAQLAGGFQPTVGFYGTRLLLHNPRLRFALMEHWQHEILNFFTSCKGSHYGRQVLQRAAVLSVILVTYRFQPESAHLFWPRVARDFGLVEGEPAKMLLRFLQETPASKLTPPAYSRRVAAAWNAVFEKCNIGVLHGRAPAEPMLLAGKPHTGRAHLSYVSAQGTPLQVPVVEAAAG